MSEAPRTLAQADVYVRRYTSRTQRRRSVRNVILLILVALVAAYFWTTRDNWPMARLVPRDAAFQLCATDLLRNRKEIAASRVWELAPKDSPITEIRTTLSGNLGMPEWIVNNLVYGLGLVSGPDLDDPTEAIFVTSISRIGCILERLRVFTDLVQEDHAGGLNLRHVPSANLYYAIRGRVFVASQDRAALVRALTLREDQALSDDDFHAIHEAAKGRNLLATLRPRASDPISAQFERLDATVALKQDAVQFDCRAIPNKDFAIALGAIFNGTNVPTLQAPVQGLVELSADFGRPFPEVWSALQLAFPGDPILETIRGGIQSASEGLGDKAGMVGKAFNGLGTGVSLTWTGIDPLEIVPAPQVIARIDAPDAAGYEVLLKIGIKDRTPRAVEADILPYYDETEKLAIFPVLGGPTMHPTVAMRDKRILLASSTTLMRDVIAGTVPMAEDGAQGHVLARIRVAPAAAAVLDAAQDLADTGYLRGFNGDTFRAFADQWKARAAQVGELTGLLAYTADTLQFRLTMTMAPAPAAPPAPPAIPAASQGE